jgi:putative ATPase
VPEAYIPQVYLPDELKDAEFYTPHTLGFEKEIAKRLAWWQELRDRAREKERPVQGAGGETSTEE